MMEGDQVIIGQRIGNFVAASVCALELDLLDMRQCNNMVVNLGWHTEESVGSEVIDDNHLGQVDIRRDSRTDDGGMNIELCHTSNIHWNFVCTNSRHINFGNRNLSFLAKL